jgi:hypothetical protein
MAEVLRVRPISVSWCRDMARQDGLIRIVESNGANGKSQRKGTRFNVKVCPVLA